MIYLTGSHQKITGNLAKGSWRTTHIYLILVWDFSIMRPLWSAYCHAWLLYSGQPYHSPCKLRLRPLFTTQLGSRCLDQCFHNIVLDDTARFLSAHNRIRFQVSGSMPSYYRVRPSSMISLGLALTLPLLHFPVVKLFLNAFHLIIS